MESFPYVNNKIGPAAAPIKSADQDHWQRAARVLRLSNGSAIG